MRSARPFAAHTASTTSRVAPLSRPEPSGRNADEALEQHPVRRPRVARPPRGRRRVDDDWGRRARSPTVQAGSFDMHCLRDEAAGPATSPPQSRRRYPPVVDQHVPGVEDAEQGVRRRARPRVQAVDPALVVGRAVSVPLKDRSWAVWSSPTVSAHGMVSATRRGRVGVRRERRGLPGLEQAASPPPSGPCSA